MKKTTNNRDDVNKIVNNYKTEVRFGFKGKEIEALLAEYFPYLKQKDVEAKIGVVTCMVHEGEMVIYHRDIALAILLCIENRDANIYEFD